MVNITYIDDLGLPETLMCSDTSLAKMLRAHGDDFVQIHRKFIVNSFHLLTALPVPANLDNFEALLRHIPYPLPISRRAKRRVFSAIDKKNMNVRAPIA